MNAATIERHASALAEVKQMQVDLVAANAEIDRLQRDLNRAEDRVSLVNEERAIYRNQAIQYRDMLVEMTTTIANIGLMTVRAEAIASRSNELLAQPAPQEDEEKSEPPALLGEVASQVVTDLAEKLGVEPIEEGHEAFRPKRQARG